MDCERGKVVLITGASSGVGKALAELLSAKGYRVYGTSRKPPAAGEDDGAGSVDGHESREGFFKLIPLDVCDQKSVKAAVEHVMEEEGRIDVLVNNAGYCLAGAVEDTTYYEALRQFDTNFFGVIRMCREVIPIMRERQSGKIINVSSVAGLISVPFQSMYSASKYALEAISEAMRIEVKPFGIKVSLIEPGDIKTGFTKNRQTVVNAGSESAYRTRFEKAVEAMVRSELNGPGPEYAARAIAEVIESDNPPVRKVVGFQYKLIVLLKRLLPARLVEYLVEKVYS